MQAAQWQPVNQPVSTNFLYIKHETHNMTGKHLYSGTTGLMLRNSKHETAP